MSLLLITIEYTTLILVMLITINVINYIDFNFNSFLIIVNASSPYTSIQSLSSHVLLLVNAKKFFFNWLYVQ